MLIPGPLKTCIYSGYVATFKNLSLSLSLVWERESLIISATAIRWCSLIKFSRMTVKPQFCGTGVENVILLFYPIIFRI